MLDHHVASLFVAMLDIPSGSATTYEPLCGVKPGVLSSSQVAISSLHSLTQTTLSKLRSKAALISKVQNSPSEWSSCHAGRDIHQA